MPEDRVDVVRRLGGRARTDVLPEHTTRRRLAAAVRAGHLRRPRRGLYVLQLPDAAVVAARVGGVVSDASAEWWGLAPVRVPDVVDVTVVRGSRRTLLAGVRYHWSPVLAPTATAQVGRGACRARPPAGRWSSARRSRAGGAGTARRTGDTAIAGGEAEPAASLDR